LGHFRGNDHFNKLTINNQFGGGGVQLAVEGDDATEGGFRIGLVGQFIGLRDAVEADCHAAGVGVLDDHAGRLDEDLTHSSAASVSAMLL
jgi:hypothetical protein